MKVVVKQWGLGADKVMELSSALEPDPMYEGGIAERAAAQADLNAEVLGNLAALLVEKGVLALDEAKDACKVYGDIEVHHEAMPSVARQAVDPVIASKWKQAAPKTISSGLGVPVCFECGQSECNGECAGDDMMGSSS